MTAAFGIMVAVIVAAILFDFLNGFHDSANAIATIVVTKTLSPAQAVLLAGLANFVGYFTFGSAVASTIGKGIILPEFIALPLLVAALSGAIIWNIITWLLGLPTSSSHALIGGLVGAAIAAAGMQSVIVPGIARIVAFIFVAPLLGGLGAILFTNIVLFVARKAKPVPAQKAFKFLQLISASFYAYSHGQNDAQKSMAIIAMALVAGGINANFKLDGWVVLTCYAAMGLGTMLGGWRIVRTMGTRITKIRAMEGFCAETSSAITILLSTHFGIPVSTTHVIAGSIMGVGTVERASAVRWVTARKIVWAWFLTIPFTAFCAALVYYAVHWILG